MLEGDCMHNLFNLFSFAYKMINYKRFIGFFYITLTLILGLTSLGFPYVAGLFFKNIEVITSKIDGLSMLVMDETILIIIAFAAFYLLLQYV